MARTARTPRLLWPLVFSTLLIGCAATHSTPIMPILPSSAASPDGPDLPSPAIRQTSFESPGQAISPACAPPTGDIPFSGASELQVDALVEHVLARSPSLAQMTAVWQAASARYPQVVSLEDPMLGETLAPASIWSNNVNAASRLEVAQKVPFPGKRGLRGKSALAEAAAASNDIDDMRLQLIESAKRSFYEYYLVGRAIEVNKENTRLLKEFREEANARYEKALVPEQDVWQADVELGRLRKRDLILNRMMKVAIARINTLMHLPPDVPLPPPPTRLTLGEALPPVEELRARAFAQRPDLRAISNRIAAEEASFLLAKKEFYPDFEVLGAYDTFWQPPQQALQGQVGVRLNLPVQRSKRYAAIKEAEARIAERRAQLNNQIDQANFQLQESYEQVMESQQAVRLYDKTILPAAKSNVAAARSAYEANRIPFLTLIEAQRNRVGLLDGYYEELADYYRRRAALERAVGGPIIPADAPDLQSSNGTNQCSDVAPHTR